MNEMRKEFRQKEVKWEGEREELRRGIDELEKKMEILMREKEEMGRRGRDMEKVKDIELGSRVKILERKLEVKEREERRRNIIIKETETKKRKRKVVVEKVRKLKWR